MPGPSFGKLLNLFQKIGYFPCKKVVKEGDEKTYLEPVKGWLQLVKFLLGFAFINSSGLVLGLVIYCLISSNHAFVDFIPEFWMTGFSLEIEGTILDITVTAASQPILFGIQVLTLWKSHKAKQHLCEAYNYLEEHGPTLNWLSEQEYKKHILKIALIVLGNSFFYAGCSMKLMERFSLGFGVTVPVILIGMALSISLFAPLVAFHLYFLETHWKLQSWIKSLKTDLKTSQDIRLHLAECHCLTKGLHLVSKAISDIVFYLFGFLLLLSVTTYYGLIRYVMTKVFTLATILLVLGYGSHGIFYPYFAYSYCTYSQAIKDSADSIKDILLKSTNCQEAPYMIDGKFLKSMKSHTKQLKQGIVLDLQKFQGFHGNGYFVLGKPLLTSVVTNHNHLFYHSYSIQSV